MRFQSRHRGLSLMLALLFFLVLPLITTLAGAGYYSLRWLEAQVEERMQEDIELIARAIRGPLEYALEYGRERGLDQTLSSAFRFGRVYGAYVYDESGQLIAGSGTREPKAKSPQLTALAAEGDRTGGFQEMDGKKVYAYFVPLSDSVGRNIGLLQLTREGSDFQQYIRHVQQRALLLLTLLSLFLVGIVIYGHYRVIGRHLRCLVRSMARIESGDRHHRAALSGPQEVRKLAMGMSDMLDSIARSERELEQRGEAQVQLERRLQQAQKMAAIGQLAAGVAHELGTPLSVVSGKAQRLLRRSDLPDLVAQSLREVRDAVRRMEHIVRQLLDFSRDNRLRLRLLPLEEIAESSAAQIRDEAAIRGVDLMLDGPKPSPGMPVDLVRLEQALINLLRNAVQASAGGCVRFEWFADDREVGFRVADDGPGISEALYPRLFDPFFTTKPVDQGIGLGLAVAQAAIRDHGGRLDVGRSDLGGALFVATFKVTEHTNGNR